MTPILWIWAVLAVLGHWAIWVTIFNRINARPEWRVRVLDKLIFPILAAVPLYLLWRLATGKLPPLLHSPPLWAVFYGGLSVVLLLAKMPRWVVTRVRQRRPPKAVLAWDVRIVDVPAELGFVPADGEGKMWRRVPGNQSWHLAVERKTLRVRGLPAALSGLTITHVSDLHLAGHVGQAYFDRMIDEANRMESDIVALTGDYVDRRSCLPWVRPLLGRLRSRHGAYYVLGNHDARPGEELVRRALDEAGLVSLGGRSLVVEVDGGQVLLAGDERPWFGGEPHLVDAPDAALRVLLAHTPDSYPWARAHRFDLVLAGHTHGGQIRLPGIGPIASPSLFGTRYASGVFHEQETLMHVSRGLSGLHPIRLWCPPELTQLTLTSDEQQGATEGTEDTESDGGGRKV